MCNAAAALKVVLRRGQVCDTLLFNALNIEDDANDDRIHHPSRLP